MRQLASPPVLTAADENYLPYLAAFLASLDANAGPAVGECVVFYRDIGQDVRGDLAALLRPPRWLRWVEVDEELCVRHGAPRSIGHAPANYFRLLAPYVCEADRAVYLDADVIVLGDMAPLMAASLHDRPLAATIDWLATVKDAIGNWRELGLDGDAPYFNSGVMVLDLEAWRSKNLSARALQICAANQEHLLAQGRWLQHEQYGVNVAVGRDWAPLERKWNHFSELPVEAVEPRIVHFVGQGKPTSHRCQRELTEAFFEMLSRTPWKGALRER